MSYSFEIIQKLELAINELDDVSKYTGNSDFAERLDHKIQGIIFSIKDLIEEVNKKYKSKENDE